jgi:hypothetical protein
MDKVNSSISAMVYETKVSTIEKLVIFLESKIEMDSDLKQMLTEFKDNLKSKESIKATLRELGKQLVVKPKRAPSTYNLYIRDKMAQFKSAGHTGNLMKMATDAWNSDKGENTKVESPKAEAPKTESKGFGGRGGGMKGRGGFGGGRGGFGGRGRK